MPVILAASHFVAAGLIMIFVNGAGLNAWRRAASAHWTEQARLVTEVRETAKQFCFILPLLLPAIWYQHDHSKFQYLLDALLVYLGAVAGSYPHLREVHTRIIFKWWFYSVFFNALYNVYLWGGLLACILFMPPVPGWSWLMVLAVFFILPNPVLLTVLRHRSQRGGFYKPAGERSQRLVHDAAASAGITTPTVWELTWPYPWINFDPDRAELFVTDKLLANFSDEEITALCSRELAKVCTGRMFWGKKIRWQLVLLPLLFIIPVEHRWAGCGAGMVLIVLILLFWQSRRSKKAEIQAEQAATGKPPAPIYVKAQEKMHCDNLTPVTGEKNPHLDLYQQMLEAGVTPDYPAPAAAPRKFTPVGRYTLLGLLFLLLGTSGSCKIETHGSETTIPATNQISNTN